VTRLTASPTPSLFVPFATIAPRDGERICCLRSLRFR
jgi:hypothetical protein